MAYFARFLRLARARPLDDLACGEQAVRAGDFALAEAAYARALAAAIGVAGRAVVHNKRALLELARGDGAAADAALAQALAADPSCVAARVNVANRLLESGAIDGAIEEYERAIRLDPDFAAAHHNLGVALKRAGRRAEAVRELRRATGLERRRRKASD